MMAGLFNYEHAYRKYTRLLLDSFQAQNIQYAEIRPNFMEKNQVITMHFVPYHRLKVS
jgi:adenosine deaminase CECR1